MPSRNLQEIVEYRGVEGLVCAEVLTDDNGEDGLTYGDVFAVAGVAEISKTTDASNEAHYYDNYPAVVVSSTSADTVTISVSAIPLDVLAAITGQYYDVSTGAIVEEGNRNVKYYAIGYRTKKTNGDEMFVWRYKGTFNIPDQTNTTENDSTDANGQEIVYTGISTTHKFTKTGKGAKAMVVDTVKELADVDHFFDTVTTPDDLAGATAYSLSITEAEYTKVTVSVNGRVLEDGDDIYAGQLLKISAVKNPSSTSGTLGITVNADNWFSGDIHQVTGNVAVVTTLT